MKTDAELWVCTSHDSAMLYACIPGEFRDAPHWCKLILADQTWRGRVDGKVFEISETAAADLLQKNDFGSYGHVALILGMKPVPEPSPDFEVWVRWYGRQNEVPELLISEPNLFVETPDWVPMKLIEGLWRCDAHNEVFIVPNDYVLKLKQHPEVAECIETDGHCYVAALKNNRWEPAYDEYCPVVTADAPDQTSTGVTLMELLEADH